MMRTIVGILALALAAQGAVVKRVCSSGCDYSTVQAAVDAASFGWIIELKAGETFAPFRLRAKTGPPQYIVIRSSRANELPGNVRVTPSDTAKMAAIQTTAGDIVVTVEKGASYYRLEGLEVRPTSGNFLYTLVGLYPQNIYGWINVHDPSDRAHHIVIDRCYIHGYDEQNGPRNGIFLETGYTEILNSWISEIKDQNSESHGILNQSGTGPFLIRNNHIEAAAIGSLFGGADPSIAGTRAGDVQFLGNHYYRPWKWRIRDVSSDPTGACKWDANGGEFAKNTTPEPDTYWKCISGTWTEITSGDYPTLTYWQKNQFELKNASRVLFDGNLIENAWTPAAQGQRGAAVLINQVGYDPGAGVHDPAAVIERLRFQNNRVKNTTFGVQIGGNGQTYYRRSNGLRFENNLFEGMAWSGYYTDSLIQTHGQHEKTYFVHNTFLDAAPQDTGRVAQMSATGSDFTYEMGWIANISGHLADGFADGEKGNGVLQNAIASQWAASSRLMSKSVFVDSQDQRLVFYWGKPWFNLRLPSTSPYDGTIPCPSCSVASAGVEDIPEQGAFDWENAGTNDVTFVGYANGNYRLASSSPYKGWAHEGRDPGADIDVVEWSTERSEDGAANPYLDFRVRAITPGRTSASIRFTGYDTTPCRVTVSERPDFATPAVDQWDEGGNRERVAEIGGLSANSRYFYRISCSGSRRREGLFLTAP